VEPCRELVIGSGKGIHHGDGHAVLGDDERIGHKKEQQATHFSTPVKGR